MKKKVFLRAVKIMCYVLFFALFIIGSLMLIWLDVYDVAIRLVGTSVLFLLILLFLSLYSEI